MSSTTSRTDGRLVVTFFAWAFGLSWTLWAPLVILREAVPPALGFTVLVLGSLVPSVVATGLTGRAGGAVAVRQLLTGLLRWRLPLPWYLLLLAPTAVTLVAVSLNSIVRNGPPAALGVPVATAIAMVVFSIFPGSALGEEVGWRGYALPRLQQRRSALGAGLLVGVLTALWHLPLWLRGAPTHPLSLYAPFAIQVVAYAVIYTWLYNGTGGSLLMAVLFHASTNAPLTLVVLPLGADSLPAIFWMISGLTTLCAAVVVVTSGPSNLSRQGRQVVSRSGEEAGARRQQPVRPEPASTRSRSTTALTTDPSELPDERPSSTTS